MSNALVTLNVRTKYPKTLRDEVREVCRERGLTLAEATRQGLMLLVAKHRAHLEPRRPQSDFAEAVEHVATAADALTSLAKLVNK